MLPPIASRFVAGETAAGAFDHARSLDERGVGTILNRLGEHYEERGPGDEDAAAYRRLVEDIAASPFRACISVKPSQLGLGVDEAVFRENLARVVTHAREHDVFVWLDMEDHTTTDATLDAFAALTAGDVGVCLQANLKRTPDDIDRLADLPGKVRLVKGAYAPPPDVAYRDRERVDEAYRTCLERAFRTLDDGVAVGTHDLAMVEHARELHAEHGTGYEVQMLMGVREDAQFDLAAECEVWQYVPYGERWLSYFSRRLFERSENFRFALRALVG
jgi:proline dehydrogenase